MTIHKFPEKKTDVQTLFDIFLKDEIKQAVIVGFNGEKVKLGMTEISDIHKLNSAIDVLKDLAKDAVYIEYFGDEIE